LLTVGELLSCGTQINKVTRQILSNNILKEKKFEFFGKLLSQAKRHSELDLIYLIVNNADLESWHKSDLENLVSTINRI